MPKLRGDQIPPTTGAFPTTHRDPAAGEVRVWCPCGWSTIRPEYAAPSARRAHAMAHEKGWV